MAKKKIEETTPEIKKEILTGTVNTLSNFRANPAFDADIIKTLDPGTKVTILGDNGDFFKIEENNDIRGFIKKDLVDLK